MCSLAITSYPFDNQDTTETDYSRLFRELQDSGVADTVGGSQFAVSANASGMRVFVQAGFALLRGHAVLSTGIEEVPIAAAASVSRIDRVVLRLDPVHNGIVLTVVEGTPGSGPPPVTQTDTGVYELPLALVTVEPGDPTIPADKVTDDRRYVSSRVGAWTTTTRPTTARKARLGLNTTTNKWEYFTGTGWVDLAPVVAWDTIAGKPASFTATAHRHRWTDLDVVPSSFTPSAHTHPWDQVTDKPAAFPPSGHGHDWHEITGKPAEFTPAGHGHDYAWSWHGHDYAWSGHGHPAPNTVNRANGSDRVHPNSPAGNGWYAVWCDGNRNFCHNTSSIRFKEHVRDHRIDPAAVLALRPVIYDRKATFNEETQAWQDGPTNEFGLIAEEVQPHLPEIVQWMDDDNGVPQIESLRYDLLPVAMLTVLHDQQARITALETQLAGLHEAVAAVLAQAAP